MKRKPKGGVLMNEYEDMKNRHQKEVNDFPMAFAFTEKQFADGMAKLGLKPDETNKVYSLGGGGFYRRSDAAKLHEMFERHAKELKDATEDAATGDEFIYKMFLYELANHEYTYTYSYTETIEALGFSKNEVYSNERLLKGMEKAAKELIKRNDK